MTTGASTCGFPCARAIDPLLGSLIGGTITPCMPIVHLTRQRDGFLVRDGFRYNGE